MIFVGNLIKNLVLNQDFGSILYPNVFEMDTDLTREVSEDSSVSKSTEIISVPDTSATSTGPSATQEDTEPSDTVKVDNTKSEKECTKSETIGESQSVGNNDSELDQVKETTEEIKPESTKDTITTEEGKNKSPQENIDSEVDRSRYVHYEGEVAVYTDPQSRQQYTWDKDKTEWKLRQIDYDFDGSNYFYTDKSGK